MGFDAEKFIADVEKRYLSKPNNVTLDELWVLALLYKDKVRIGKRD